MSASRLPIALPDYQRIVRILKSVYDTSGAGGLHTATFFSIAGARILQEHYKKKSQPVAGTAQFKIDDPAQSVVSLQEPALQAPDNASQGTPFHCWVVCDGYVIDFMAPVFAASLRARGVTGPVSRKMFQKPVSAMADSPLLMQKPGDFYMLPDVGLTRKVLDAFHGDERSNDLVEICVQWFRRPPKDVGRELGVERTDGEVINMKLADLSLDGVW